jgi:hypothetical protein
MDLILTHQIDNLHQLTANIVEHERSRFIVFVDSVDGSLRRRCEHIGSPAFVFNVRANARTRYTFIIDTKLSDAIPPVANLAHNFYLPRL